MREAGEPGSAEGAAPSGQRVGLEQPGCVGVLRPAGGVVYRLQRAEAAGGGAGVCRAPQCSPRAPSAQRSPRAQGGARVFSLGPGRSRDGSRACRCVSPFFFKKVVFCFVLFFGNMYTQRRTTNPLKRCLLFYYYSVRGSEPKSRVGTFWPLLDSFGGPVTSVAALMPTPSHSRPLWWESHE